MREAILLTDGYKLDHRRQYPEGTEYVYSNWTPRSCHYMPDAEEGVVVFGIQYFIKEYLIKQFHHNFFDKPKAVAEAESFYEEVILSKVREITPHGKCGPNSYSMVFEYNGTYTKITLKNIGWNRYDKQYYYIDMWEKAKFECETLDPTIYKGSYELLWDLFGGTVNEKGFKVLDSHIGMIYGGSIDLDKEKEIYRRLEEKNFAATNLVLGYGSYTYQFKSRDSLGFAMKATWCQINGDPYNIFKDPKTDDGVKKSLKGLIMVGLDEYGNYHAYDQVSKVLEKEGYLQTVFEDDKLLVDWTLKDIRKNVDASI